MASPLPTQIELNKRQISCLTQLTLQYHKDHRLYLRSQILLLAHEGMNNSNIAEKLFLKRDTVAEWRKRWLKSQKSLNKLAQEINPQAFKNGIIDILSDKPRPGAPIKFTDKHVRDILNLANKLVEKYSRIGQELTYKTLAEEAQKHGIVRNISISSIRRILQQSGFRKIDLNRNHLMAV